MGGRWRKTQQKDHGASDFNAKGNVGSANFYRFFFAFWREIRYAVFRT
jgi:hypothetical protein